MAFRFEKGTNTALKLTYFAACFVYLKQAVFYLAMGRVQ